MQRLKLSATLAAAMAGVAAGLLIAVTIVDNSQFGPTELEGSYLVSKDDLDSAMQKADAMAVRGMSPEYSPGMGMKRRPIVPGRMPSHRLAEDASSWPNDFYNQPSVHVEAGPDSSHEWYNMPSEFTPPELDNSAAWYNKPSEFTPPELDKSAEWYNKPSKFTPPEQDRSFDRFNNMLLPRNCVGGSINCCPEWAREQGLCPPEEGVPTPQTWY